LIEREEPMRDDLAVRLRLAELTKIAQHIDGDMIAVRHAIV
jgi:hypothetical protein